MVTKVAGNQGQITLKGVPITDEWQQLVTVAAKRNGQTFAEFVADVTRAAALAIVKGEAAVTAAVPAPDRGCRRQPRRADRGPGRAPRARLERASRRGRWRR